jgi:hypothetical protein
MRNTRRSTSASPALSDRRGGTGARERTFDSHNRLHRGQAVVRWTITCRLIEWSYPRPAGSSFWPVPMLGVVLSLQGDALLRATPTVVSFWPSSPTVGVSLAVTPAYPLATYGLRCAGGVSTGVRSCSIGSEEWVSCLLWAWLTPRVLRWHLASGASEGAIVNQRTPVGAVYSGCQWMPPACLIGC